MDVVFPSSSYHVGKVLQGREPHTFDVGPDGHVWFVIPLLEEQAALLAPSDRSTGDPPPITPFRIVEMAQGRVLLDIEIACPVDELDWVNPLDDGVLVASSRAEELRSGEWESNAWVYGRDRVLKRDMHLGDAIEDLQVAADGSIWTSYFDEGYSGHSEGSASLVAWDGRGTPMFRLTDDKMLCPAEDIVALNVASDRDTWCIHCAEGAILHLCERRVAGLWALPGAGSRALAVLGQDMLLAGAWGPRFSMPDITAMFAGLEQQFGEAALKELPELFSGTAEKLGKGVAWGDERDEASKDFVLSWLKLRQGGSTSVEGTFALRTHGGEAIEPTAVRGRGNRLFVLAGETLYEVALADVVPSSR